MRPGAIGTTLLCVWAVAAGGSAAWADGLTPVLGVSALLIPQSATTGGMPGRGLWAVSPETGEVWSDRILGPNNTLFMTPFKAVVSPAGTYYVSDQTRNAVYEFALDGSLLRTVVSVVQPRGILLHEGFLYVPVGDNTGDPFTQNTVHRYTLDGVAAGLLTRPDGSPSPVFSRPADYAGRSPSPWDLLVHGGQMLLSNFHNSGGGNPVMPDVFRIDMTTGAAVPLVIDPLGLSGAQQLFPMPGGGFAVAGFSNTFETGVNTAGIYVYDANGIQSDYFNLAFGPRGIYRMPSGDWLFSTADGLRVLNGVTRHPDAVQVPGTDNGQFRMITPGLAMTRPVIPEPGGLAALACGGVLVLGRWRRRA